MNTTDLRALLRGATDGLEPSSDFARRVLHGGRRRRLRRRLAAAGSAVVAVVLTAVTAVVVVHDDGAPPVADPRLTAPTKGDLAQDQAFLDDAVQAWRDGLHYSLEAGYGYYDDPRGAPHVYWAGNTPAGRAAIVLQQIDVPDRAQVRTSGLRTAEGLVAIDPEDGRLKLVSTRPVGADVLGRANYYKFGPDDGTMLIVDEGRPLYYTWEFLPGYGRIGWKRAEPYNGVALVTLNNPTRSVAYQGNQPPGLVDWESVPSHLGQAGTASEYLRLRMPVLTFRTSFLPWKEEWHLGAPLRLPATKRDLIRQLEFIEGLRADYVSPWTIFATLSDGRVVAVYETQNRGGVPRLGVLVLEASYQQLDGGLVDRNAVLPVKYHIPQGGGWIIAQRGQSLSYRTEPNGPWIDAGRDAALVPEGAVGFKVGDKVV